MQTDCPLAVPVIRHRRSPCSPAACPPKPTCVKKPRSRASPAPDGKLNLNDDEKKAFIEDIRQALYASKIVAYAQGFNEITTAAKEYGWDIDLAAVARIWRGGCIIRAKFLNRISEAFESGEANVSLLFAPYFKNAIENAEKSWRNVVAQAARQRSPTPAFASSLSYFDGLRSKRLPAALIQGQRDYFGAHTYQRVDQPGAFHTLMGRTRAAKRSKPDLFLASVSGRICQRSCDVFHCKTSGICILLSCDIAVPLHWTEHSVAP